ncbi:hypothetical protein IV102_06915 [bacterium]|nr:hypothetical protein [bacterium]
MQLAPASVSMPSAPRGLKSLRQPDPIGPNDPKDKLDKASSDEVKQAFKKVIVGGACTVGGLACGYFVGGMAGGVLQSAPRLAAFGSTAGAALGALFGSALYLRGDDDAVVSLLRCGITATMGGTTGLLVGTEIGPVVAGITSNPAFATYGALAAAISGTLLGAASSRLNHNDAPSFFLKQAASASTGATIGWGLGGVATSVIAGLGASVPYGPVLGAVAGGLVGAASHISQHKEDHYEQYPDKR